MSEREVLEARRDELRSSLAAARARLGMKQAEVDRANSALRATRDARRAKVTQLEAAAAELTEQVRRLRETLAEALRDEQAARAHLWDLKGHDDDLTTR